MTVLIRNLAFAGLTIAISSPAIAQSYPERNVKLVVAFAPGGPTDVGARILGAALQEKWGKPVVIENRGGAGGNIGAVAVARAEPDGYTILVTTSAYSINLTYNSNPGYTANDLRPAALLATTPNIIVGSPTLKADTLKEAMEIARTEKFSYASAGAGTAPHLSAERVFKLIGKLDVRHVPFTGAAPAMNAVSAGHVQFGVVAMTPAIQLVKTGALKGYAVTSAKRAAELPEVPTVLETGIGAIDDATWVALFVPEKTPQVIIGKINRDINEILKQPPVALQISKAGLDPLSGNLPEVEAYVTSENKKWEEVINATGTKGDDPK